MNISFQQYTLELGGVSNKPVCALRKQALKLRIQLSEKASVQEALSTEVKAREQAKKVSCNTRCTNSAQTFVLVRVIPIGRVLDMKYHLYSELHAKLEVEHDTIEHKSAKRKVDD